MSEKKIVNSVIYINAQSVLANMPKIEVMCSENKPLILCCSEARITEEINETEYEIEGYNNIVCFSSSRHTGGAVIYIRKSIKYKVIKIESKDLMFWSLSIEVLDCAIRGIIGIIYRSPSYRLDDSLNNFDNFLDTIINLRKCNTIMGDINIDMNKDKNADVAKLNRIFDKYDLVQCVNFDTRITDRSATKIDFVVSNKSDAVRCDKLINYKISDHETIKIDQICDKQMECATEKVLSWKNYSKIDLIDNIRKCDWSRFYSCDINKKVELINKNLTKSVAPLTKQVIINSNLKPKKWFDSELSQMKREKIAKYKEWFDNKCEEKWNIYIATRNKYNKLIKNKKINIPKMK